LFRAQTGFATYYTIVIPYLLAGGNYVTSLLLIPPALILHYATFGHNSVMDYWYDVKDIHKQHHPLVSGVLRLSEAHKAIHSMLVVIFTVFVLVTLLTSPRAELALTFLLGYAVFGHAYNDGLDKNTAHSWIPISLCFTCLGIYGWFLASSNVTLPLLLLSVVMFTSIFYQIAFEGNLKDICVENTLLNRLAREVVCKYEGGRTKIKYLGVTFGWLRVFVDTGIILSTIVFVGGGIPAIVILLVLTSIQTSLISGLTSKVRVGIDRDEMLEYFGRVEALQFFRMMTVIIRDVTSLIMYVVLVTLGVCYFILMNKVLWGSRWGPKV